MLSKATAYWTMGRSLADSGLLSRKRIAVNDDGSKCPPILRLYWTLRTALCTISRLEAERERRDVVVSPMTHDVSCT
jgi:hypothetical protein